MSKKKVEKEINKETEDNARVNDAANNEQTVNQKEKDEQKEDAPEEETSSGLTEEQKAARQIEKLTAEVAQASEKYIYLMAEFDNYRRRTAKDRLELIDSASKDVITGLLPVLDDCQRALQVLKESDASEAAKEGTELIFNKLMNYLKSRGLAVIEAKEKDFDTDFHEAVAQFPAPSPEMKNKVIDVTQEGYTLNGKVIRFAKVVVGI